MAYYYQCPRCRGMNKYGWAELMAHYRQEHPGIIDGKRREGEYPYSGNNRRAKAGITGGASARYPYRARRRRA